MPYVKAGRLKSDVVRQLSAGSQAALAKEACLHPRGDRATEMAGSLRGVGRFFARRNALATTALLGYP